MYRRQNIRLDIFVPKSLLLKLYKIPECIANAAVSIFADSKTIDFP